MTAVTQELARLVVTSQPGAAPQEVRHEAKRSLVNWLGSALGGCGDEAVTLALSALREFAGPAQATVIGRGIRTDVMYAALLNAISSNILDFDDTLAHMVVHPTAPVASALFALAERRPVIGASLLE